jgi:translation elongation factor EF-1beta
VALAVLTNSSKMANAIVTFKVMPESPDSDMAAIQVSASKILKASGAKGDVNGKLVPIAFGIKHLYLTAVFETSDKGNDYDAMTNEIDTIEGVSESKVEKIDLAMG